jgi:hypothetical protein
MVLFAAVKPAVSAVFVVVSRLRHLEAEPFFAKLSTATLLSCRSSSPAFLADLS